MARQRFIWPEIWKDPVFGRLTPDEQLFFIACFSLADDDGRLFADPAYLRSEMFTYRAHSLKKVQAIRNSVVKKVRSLHLYQVDGTEFIALLRWTDYQHPKYPKASKIPSPFDPDSVNLGGKLGEDSSVGWDGLGRDGKGRVGAVPNEERDQAVEKLLKGLKIKDLDERAETELYVRGVAESFSVPAPFLTVLEDVREQRAKQDLEHEGRYAVSILKRMRDEGQYAA